MRTCSLLAAGLAVGLASSSARAGELDLGFGLGAVHTAWAGDHGGGGSLDASWWLTPWIAIAFVGKEQYAMVDERLLEYLSVNVEARHTVGTTRLIGALGVVHQHEEPWPGVSNQPIQSVLGVGDGIRHRAGVRGGARIAVPLRRHRHGDYYAALELDATWFGDDRGPRWMIGAGLAVGFTYDFAKAR